MTASMSKLARAVLQSSLSVLLMSIAAGEAAELQWYAELSGDNPDFVKVLIDTRMLERNVLVRGVRVTIEFYDSSGTSIGFQRYAFTDAAMAVLEGGQQYRKFFEHPYGQATLAKGVDLYSGGPGGGEGSEGAKFDRAPFKAGKRIQESTATRTLGPTPGKKERSQGDLLRTVFRFPGDGQANQNRTIGPFCCTGETATVRRGDGQPVGYIYFFDWRGQALDVGGVTVIPALEIKLSGLGDLADLQSGQQEGSVLFPASELVAGASRSARAGGLNFKVIVQAAKKRNVGGRALVEMQSVVLAVYVSPSK